MLITLEEAKEQLGMFADETEDEPLLESLIAAAAQHFESQYGIVADQVPDRSWSFDSFANWMVIPELPVVPDTVTISYLDGNGADQQVEGFRVRATGKFHRLLPGIAQSWPTPADAAEVITVAATVGYNADAELSDATPADIKVAARMTVAHWYNNREAFGAGQSEIPMGAAALLSPYKLMRV